MYQSFINQVMLVMLLLVMLINHVSRWMMVLLIKVLMLVPDDIVAYQGAAGDVDQPCIKHSPPMKSH